MSKTEGVRLWGPSVCEQLRFVMHFWYNEWPSRDRNESHSFVGCDVQVQCMWVQCPSLRGAMPHTPRVQCPYSGVQCPNIPRVQCPYPGVQCPNLARVQCPFFECGCNAHIRGCNAPNLRGCNAHFFVCGCNAHILGCNAPTYHGWTAQVICVRMQCLSFASGFIGDECFLWAILSGSGILWEWCCLWLVCFLLWSIVPESVLMPFVSE